MAHQFRRETLATIRRRVGYLVHRDKFVYGTVTSNPSSSSFVLTEAKTKQTGTLAGCVAYVVAGTGLGQRALVTANTAGTGVVVVATSWAVSLSTDSVIEIWPNYGPDEVNAAINEAINDAQDQALVRDVDDNPTLDATRQIITPAATFIKVYSVTWKDSYGYWYRARPVNYVDDLKWVDAGNYAFAPQGGSVFLNAPIPSDITGTSIHIGGYRLPNLLSADTDQAEMRSDYLVYKSAVLLESSKIANPQFDPEGHAQRANVWLREVARTYPSLNTEIEPNTMDL